MSTNFPSALDTFTNPNGSDSLNAAAVPHAEQHANANDAIEALQAKVGINGSAVATSLDYRISTAETGLDGKISSSEKGSANGVATLGFDGKVPSSQLPPLDYIPTSEKGAAGGVAGLDEAGKVPAAQLPSYVDDILEYANLTAFPATGEAGKIYVALDTNKTYRWSGSAYVYITSGAVDSVAGKTGVVVLAKADVGLDSVDNTTDANKPISTATQTALDGKSAVGHNHDTAYEAKNANIQSHITSTFNPHGVTKSQVGLSNVDNTADVAKPISTAQQTALDLKAPLNSPALTGTASITANTASPALTITQTGTGDALRVEDSASPDSTPFVIDANGNVGIGVTPTANTSSGLFLSKDIGFTGSNKVLTGNIYFDGDWKYFGNGTGAYIKLAGSSTSAVEIGYAYNNSSGTGAVANAVPAIILNNVGGVGIGGGPAGAGQSVNVTKNMTGATISLGIASSGNVRSDVTSQACYFQSFANTQAATFTCGGVIHYLAEQGTFGAGSTVINQYGFYASSALTGAINNYGFFSSIASGTGSWNFYAAGTAANYFAGNVGIGIAPIASTANIQSNADIGLSGPNRALMLNAYYSDGWKYAANGYAGFIKSDDFSGGGIVIATAPLNSSGAGVTAHLIDALRITPAGNVEVQTPALLGYGTGAGGTVTQATSKSTAVTLNKPTGQITMNNAALAAGASVVFLLSNSLLTASDSIVVQPSFGTNYQSYIAQVTFCGSGGAYIRVTNISAASLSEALILKFAVLKGATA